MPVVFSPPPGPVSRSVHADEEQHDEDNKNDDEHPRVGEVAGPLHDDRQATQRETAHRERAPASEDIRVRRQSSQTRTPASARQAATCGSPAQLNCQVQAGMKLMGTEPTAEA